jgi:phosphopantetheinyl transferase
MDDAHRPLMLDECRVWWARPEELVPHVPALQALLDHGERRRCARYVRPDDRLRFTVAHALARLLLGAQLGVRPAELRFRSRCPRCGNGHGKPALVVEGPMFSISHSGDRVALALSLRAPLGVDVERVEPQVDVDGLAALALSPLELRAHTLLAPDDRVATFFQRWVRKEALLKATGFGLAVPLSSITLAVSGRRVQVREWGSLPASLEPVHLYDLRPGPGYAASVAVLGGPEPDLQELDAMDLLRLDPAADASRQEGLPSWV